MLFLLLLLLLLLFFQSINCDAKTPKEEDQQNPDLLTIPPNLTYCNNIGIIAFHLNIYLHIQVYAVLVMFFSIYITNIQVYVVLVMFFSIYITNLQV